ncbi:MAG: hypothetical protein SWY16_01750 [Cyanobacteriota bacterium]|nr:hypothetical protein [Cyanobacteriota bacterium]
MSDRIWEGLEDGEDGEGEGDWATIEFVCLSAESVDLRGICGLSEAIAPDGCEGGCS